MRARTMLLAGLAAALMLAWPSVATQGAIILLGGQDGTEDPPQPTDGAETEEDWNPTVTCSVAPYGNIWDLLECLLDEISNPPPACTPIGTPDPVDTLNVDGAQGDVGLVVDVAPNPGHDDCYPYPHDRSDFTVTLVPPPHYGVEIRRLNGGEIERVSLRENDPGIQTTALEMEPVAGRFARIGQIDEVPTGGVLSLTVNDQVLQLGTRRSFTPVEATADLLRGLRSRGFRVQYETPYLYVHDDVRGIYRVEFRSTDPGIVKSDLSLFPADQAPDLDDDGPTDPEGPQVLPAP